MNIERQPGRLSVTGLSELNATNARAFRSAIATSLAEKLQTIELDLSQTQSLDAAALGALVSLYEAANGPDRVENVVFRLANPRPPVQQLLELARLHHLFEIAPIVAAEGAHLNQPKPE